MTRDDYLAKAKQIIDAAEKREPYYAGACSDCRWSSKGWFAISANCRNPVVELAARQANQGYHRDRTLECDYQRGPPSYSVYGPIVCGPDGALFE